MSESLRRWNPPSPPNDQRDSTDNSSRRSRLCNSIDRFIRRPFSSCTRSSSFRPRHRITWYFGIALVLSSWQLPRLVGCYDNRWRPSIKHKTERARARTAPRNNVRHPLSTDGCISIPPPLHSLENFSD